MRIDFFFRSKIAALRAAIRAEWLDFHWFILRERSMEAALSRAIIIAMMTLAAYQVVVFVIV